MNDGKEQENPIVVMDEKEIKETENKKEAKKPLNREERRARAKKRARKRRIATALAIIASLLAGYAAGRYQYLAKQAFAGEQVSAENRGEGDTSEPEPNAADDAGQTPEQNAQETADPDSVSGIEEAEAVDYGVEVPKPEDYTLFQALKVIRGKEDSDERYSKILEDPSIYPEKLLINLANNPEQLDFVYNYPQDTTDNSKAVLTEDEKNAKCPLFIQWDKRWGYLTYGVEDEKENGENVESNIAISGCGPTALAMVVEGLTKDSSITPAVVAEYAMNNGHYMNGTGTAWSLMLEGAKDFGLTSERIGINPSTMKKALDKGAFLILSMQPGDFTIGGHFIVIYGYDDNGFYVNDPNCVARSRQWTYDELSGQIKGIWSLRTK